MSLLCQPGSRLQGAPTIENALFLAWERLVGAIRRQFYRRRIPLVPTAKALKLTPMPPGPLTPLHSASGTCGPNGKGVPTILSCMLKVAVRVTVPCARTLTYGVSRSWAPLPLRSRFVSLDDASARLSMDNCDRGHPYSPALPS